MSAYLIPRLKSMSSMERVTLLSRRLFSVRDYDRVRCCFGSLDISSIGVCVFDMLVWSCCLGLGARHNINGGFA